MSPSEENCSERPLVCLGGDKTLPVVSDAVSVGAHGDMLCRNNSGQGSVNMV